MLLENVLVIQIAEEHNLRRVPYQPARNLSVTAGTVTVITRLQRTVCASCWSTSRSTPVPLAPLRRMMSVYRAMISALRACGFRVVLFTIWRNDWRRDHELGTGAVV